MPGKILHIKDAFVALKNGNEKGLAYYFDELYAPLFYFACSITQSEAASQDIVSDSFLKLWENHSSLLEEAHVKNFLYNVVRNSSINFLRQKKKDRERENTLLQLTPLAETHILEKLIETETYKELYRIYERLPPKSRQIFEMFYIDKKTVKDIATELSISVNTVKSQKLRALQLLKEYMAEQNLLFLLACLLFRNLK